MPTPLTLDFGRHRALHEAEASCADRGVRPAQGRPRRAAPSSTRVTGPQHRLLQRRHADRARQNRLMAAGFRVRRNTGPRLQGDPDGIVAEIESLLAQSEPTIG